jgi:hypothetical protein
MAMAVSESTLAAYAHFTKRLYIDRDGAKNVANHSDPLWDMIDHSLEDTWEGDGNAGWSSAWGRNQAVGAVFATVQGNIDNNKGSRFNFTSRCFSYGFAQITGEAIKATRSKRGSVEKAVTDTMDQTVQTMKDRLSLFLWGDGGGCIGRGASIDTNTITLANADDAKNFQEGQYVQFSATQTGGSIKAGQTQITHVNYGLTTSTITVDDITDITAHAATDYIFNASDYDAVPHGLAAWIPTTNPSPGESFFGVDRSKDNLRLAGHRLDGSGYGTIKEVAQDLARMVGRLSKGDKAGFLNGVQWTALEKDLATKATRDPSNKATFGYRFIEQDGPNGTIRWYSANNCPVDRMYILDPMDMFVLSLGGVPHINDDDGQALVRCATKDAVEARWRFMGQYGVRNPVKHGVAILATS